MWRTRETRPAYTEMALFARLDADGQLHLINYLGIALGADPEEMLTRLDRGDFQASDIGHDLSRWGADHDYVERVHDINSDKPARFNANPQRLFEASGCAGKVVVFAVRLDTFPADEQTRVFYIGTRDPGEFAKLRRDVLSGWEHLPVLGEYMHRSTFNIAERYGRDTFLSIQRVAGARHWCYVELGGPDDRQASATSPVTTIQATLH